MARFTLTLLAALAAQQVAAVPVVFPSKLFPSLTLTSIPLPTGAKLDHVPRKEEEEVQGKKDVDVPITLFPSVTLTGLPLPTGARLDHVPRGEEQQVDRDADFPSKLFPSKLFPSLTLTGLPIPTGAHKLDHVPRGGVEEVVEEEEEEEDLVERHADLSFTLLPSVTLPSVTLPTLSGITLPTLTASLAAQKKKHSPPMMPIGSASGILTGLPSLPTGLPSGPLPTGPASTGVPRYPGGLLQPGRN